MTNIKKPIALICGISGQDGCYLAQFLLSKGYIVFGTSRDAQGSSFTNLVKLGIKNQVHLLSMAPEDFRSVLVALKKSNPDEVYNLAGQSSVALSFELPAETIQSITIGTLNILEACRMLERRPRIYHSCSGECFGDTLGKPANEFTPFHPMSPYAVAQTSAYWLMNNYRDAYGLFACTGILFNHESPLRPERFVTQKIIQAAKNIIRGSSDQLTLGRLNISRDWGWAPEYVKAMWLMLQQDTAQDFVISTGTAISLEDFVRAVFEHFGLDWRDHVIQDEKLFRPADASISFGNSKKAEKLLGWRARIKAREVERKMIVSQL